MSQKVGRNQPCPCGSGKKYKHCCWGSGVGFKSKNTNLYVFGGVVVVGLAAVFFLLADEPPPATTPGYQPVQPGPAPPGKVWSSEHGHWHDAPGAATPTTPLLPTLQDSTKLTPQPTDTAPAGKVWSPEHGHWHDIQTSDSF